jgi:hypothetical protein
MSSKLMSIRQRVYAVIAVVHEVREGITEDEMVEAITLLFPMISDHNAVRYYSDWKFEHKKEEDGCQR